MDLLAKAFRYGPSIISAEDVFYFFYNVSTAATYNISSHWSIYLHANATGQPTCGGKVLAYLSLFVNDLTASKSTLAPNVVLIDQVNHSTFSSTRLRNTTLSATVSMVPNHSYVIETYVTGYVRACGKGTVPPSSTYFGSTAYLDMAAPYGATLRWVTIA